MEYLGQRIRRPSADLEALVNDPCRGRLIYGIGGEEAVGEGCLKPDYLLWVAENVGEGDVSAIYPAMPGKPTSAMVMRYPDAATEEQLNGGKRVVPVVKAIFENSE